MTAEELTCLLKDWNACPEAIAWCAEKTLAEAWEQSERGDWMLWLCAKMTGEPGWPSRQDIVLALSACAEPALKATNADLAIVAHVSAAIVRDTIKLGRCSHEPR